MLIGAGELRERVNIESQTPGSDDYGKTEGTWTKTARNVPANVKPLRAYEQMKADIAESNTEFIVRMRYRDGITSAMRLLWKSKPLYISGVVDVQSRRIVLEISCTTVRPANG